MSLLSWCHVSVNTNTSRFFDSMVSRTATVFLDSDLTLSHPNTQPAIRIIWFTVYIPLISWLSGCTWAPQVRCKNSTARVVVCGCHSQLSLWPLAVATSLRATVRPVTLPQHFTLDAFMSQPLPIYLLGIGWHYIWNAYREAEMKVVRHAVWNWLTR